MRWELTGEGPVPRTISHRLEPRFGGAHFVESDELKPRRLAARPVSLPHPLHASPLRVFVAEVNVCKDDFRQLFADDGDSFNCIRRAR
jgi:hypothetical protein